MGKAEEWSSIIENLDLWESFDAVMSFISPPDEIEAAMPGAVSHTEVKIRPEGRGLKYEPPWEGAADSFFEDETHSLIKSYDSSFQKWADAFSENAQKGMHEAFFDGEVPLWQTLFESQRDIGRAVFNTFDKAEDLSYPVGLKKSFGELFYHEEGKAYERLGAREESTVEPRRFTLPTLNNEAESIEQWGGKELLIANFTKDAPDKTKAEKILKSVKKEAENTHVHQIKVEMAESTQDGADFDVDEMLEKMTERLCNMMARGADGIYL